MRRISKEENFLSCRIGPGENAFLIDTTQSLQKETKSLSELLILKWGILNLHSVDMAAEFLTRKKSSCEEALLNIHFSLTSYSGRQSTCMLQITTLCFAQHFQACEGHLQGDKLKNTDRKYQT
jgi:hypothetical protein